MPLSPSPVFASTTTTAKRSLRILYADDMGELRELVQICLRRDGHEVACVPDGAAAVERVTADGDYDLVITDHHMPALRGLEVVQALRQLRFRGRIMVLSSELSPAVIADYEQLGVDRILMKPVFPSQLRAIVDELFSVRAG